MYMEHYKKKQSVFYEEEPLANEMRITATGKPADLATRALHTLRENQKSGVVISASGGHVTKAVTVAELVKRKLKGLHQDTEIKYSKVVDIWEPDKPQLDSMRVTRRIPSIAIRLTQSETTSPTVAVATPESQKSHAEPPKDNRGQEVKSGGKGRGRAKGRGSRPHPIDNQPGGLHQTK